MKDRPQTGGCKRRAHEPRSDGRNTGAGAFLLVGAHRPNEGKAMRRSPRKPLALAALAGLAAGAMVVQPADGARKLRLRAAPNGALRFTKERLQTAPGRVTVVLRNPASSGRRHGVEVEGKGIEKESRVAAPGQTVTVTVRLKRGRYEYYCPVDHHKQAGMEGRLIVG